MEKITVGLIVIATGKYDRFVKPLVDSVNEHFFKDRRVTIYLFCDDFDVFYDTDRVRIIQFEVDRLPWPYPTLYRYKWITQYSALMWADNLYYCDVDMLFVDTVGEEILPDDTGLVATRHPGFYNGGWGDHKTSKLSTAYIEPSQRTIYYAGGFQGGAKENYLSACREMAENIDIDSANGIMAQWNDESHWNYYLKQHPHKELSPEYCMVEQMDLRQKWGISHLTPRLIALKKDHKEVRS